MVLQMLLIQSAADIVVELVIALAEAASLTKLAAAVTLLHLQL